MTDKGSWESLDFDSLSTVGDLTGSPSKTAGKKCLLLRGNDNLLSKVCKDGAAAPTPELLADIRQEVRALWAHWLKMQSVCALLGAGASKCVAGFVGRDLFPKIQSLLIGRPSSATLEKILTFVSDPGEVGKRFEEFLSELAVFSRLAKTSSGLFSKLPEGWCIEKLGLGNVAPEKLRGLLLDIERAIITICNVRLPPSELTLATTPVVPHEAFLAKLVSRDPQQNRGRLFTTNYDTLLEQAMDRLGIVYCDGFTGTVARRFNPASYDLDLYYPGEVAAGKVRRYDKVLHLYKIHGSINWRRATQEASDPFGVVIDAGPMPDEKQVISKPPLLDTVLPNPETGRPEQGLAILPTSNKYAESVTLPYSHLFRSMAQALREPQTALLVIGYSGWDSHINRIIEDALTNPGFTCIIVNPSLTDWSKKLIAVDYCGRVYAFAGEWADFEFFAKEMLPDLEILKTELSIARTIRDLSKSKDSE